MAVLSLDRIKSLSDGLDHPEGVTLGPDGKIYAGGEQGQVYRVDPDSGDYSEISSTGGFSLGLALDGDGNIYVCDLGSSAVKRITRGGEVATYSTGAVDTPMRTPNYPVFDKDGNLYVSDSGDWKGENALVYRIEPGGRCGVWSRSTPNFANGLALSPDGGHLYVVESVPDPRVSRIEIQPGGTAGAAEIVVKLPGTVPDGLAFDRKGNMYISCYRPDRIYRYTTAGELVLFADDPEGTVLSAPTNVQFAGANLERLIIASLGRWHLADTVAPIPGQPLHYPQVARGIVSSI